MLRKKGLLLVIGLAALAAACSAGLAQDDAPPTVTAATATLETTATVQLTEAVADEPLPAYPIVDTGQTYCYSDTASIPCPQAGQADFGQDAQYQGAQAQYLDNGDGTVSDLVTGLMWVQQPIGKMSYRQAVDGAAGYSLAGYHDWRVPTIKELFSLMDFNGIDPSEMSADPDTLTPFIDTDYFGFEYGDVSAGSRVIDSQWVTSNIYESTVFSGQQCFFGVNFADGRIKCYPTADTGRNAGYFVRYVRGSTTYGQNQFVDNGDGTVSDQATGLTWMQADSGQALGWSAALAYCETLDYAGRSDWRLPNIKELQSLVDYSRSPDTTGSPAIDPLFQSTTITNEAGEPDWPYMWSSTTHVNQRGYQNTAYISFGRALGFMQQFGGWLDVHGAGAQRSDPKSGSSSDYPQGMGPQGDARRAQNYARCVSGGISAEVFIRGALDSSASGTVRPAAPGQGGGQGAGQQGGNAPQQAIQACASLSAGDACSFTTPRGEISGACAQLISGLACVP